MKIEMIDAPGTELTVQARAALALNSSKTEADLLALAMKNMHIVAVVDKAGRQQAHGAAMELKTTRTSIAKVSKDARDDATQFQKACIAEEKRLIAIIEPEEARLIGLRDAWDDEQECIRREAEERERARITAIHERIAAIRAYANLAGQCRTAARVDEVLGKLINEERPSFEEFAEEAAMALASTVKTITAIYEERTVEEAERARLKAEGEAAAARLAEQRKAQEEEAAKLAAERADIERGRAELAAAKAAAAKAIEDAKPKVEPVDEFAAQVKEFAAAVQVTEQMPPIAPSLVEQFNKAYAAEEWNPTDVEILDALCIHFKKSERLVFERLAKGFDLVELEASCFDDVPL